MRILVADDEPTSRLIAQLALRGLGHECDTVVDGAQAWDAFRSSPPDVVISDWMMPGLSGLELCRNIRAHTAASYTYFILVTGQGAPDQIIEGMNAGADDYLIKPLDTDALQVRLIVADRVTSLHRQLAHQRTELEELNHELTVIALRDPLTGLGNRRALEEDLGLLEARVARYGHRYSIALVDVDLKEEARGGDAVYRYGGEEFLCVFPEQSLAKATVAAERMRSALEGLAIPHSADSLGVVTLSAGLAMLDPRQTKSVGEVVKEADEALYRAKQLGRNRVESLAAQPA